MKYLKMTFILASLVLSTNMVIARGQRTVANPGVSVETRSVEDIVKNSDDFVAVTPGSNTRKMSSKSSKDKNKTATTLATAINTNQAQATEPEPEQADNKNVMKKFKRFSDKEGEKKNRKKL